MPFHPHLAMWATNMASALPTYEMKIEGIDDTALKAAFASGDEAAVDREWNIWIAKLQAKAAKDPVFAKWFDQFCKDQELLLRWDNIIGDKGQ